MAASGNTMHSLLPKPLCTPSGLHRPPPSLLASLLTFLPPIVLEYVEFSPFICLTGPLKFSAALEAVNPVLSVQHSCFEFYHREIEGVRKKKKKKKLGNAARRWVTLTSRMAGPAHLSLLHPCHQSQLGCLLFRQPLQRAQTTPLATTEGGPINTTQLQRLLKQ